MPLQNYLKILNNRYKTGISKEHSYRGDLENLIRELVKGVEITNEPANVTDCGNPDYVITRQGIPIGYIEAKDIGKDLNNKQYNEQFTRYKKALDNLIITDYLWFQFFQNGELVQEIKIGKIENNEIEFLPENFDTFLNAIQDFCRFEGLTIKSPKKLAELMAGKARLLQNILENAIISDEENNANTTLKDQYESFKKILIHDLNPKEFTDIYAQTLAYGMFAARLNDPSLETFSRQEAAELIPKTNPFLRKLFQYVAGYDIDERIKNTVNNLAEVFRATNVEELMKNFGKSTQTNDPIIHFYETFLSEYDPKLRKSRGVWYTPEPVVNFIVKAVDDILKTDFNLSQGLADTTKTKIQVDTSEFDKKQKTTKKIEKEVHKVQILDPATGTGTFLAEVVKFIYNKKFSSMQGAWSSYVEEHLIPRLNGFELLMASYAMAHLKLEMLLKETGYEPKKEQRFNVYLTNSLEEHHPDTGTLFATWLSNEANEANHIKRDTPVMVIIGNPPYSVSSSNKSEWIEKLMIDYKKNLNEKNIQPLSDDYLKFIRFGQYFIEKNGEGILAFISNNSFVDGIIHRQFRKHLLENFDKIYILNLHGNSRKKEVCPDGSKDENVFDIMQGVSINIFIKTGKKKVNELGEVYHYDLYGKRDDKYDFLWNNNLESIKFTKLPNVDPSYFFVEKSFEGINEYENGFKIDEVFKIFNAGSATGKDELFVDIKKNELLKKLELNNIIFDSNKIEKYNYRLFDIRYFIYDNKLIQRLRHNLMKNLKKENICLITTKILSSQFYTHSFVSNIVGDRCVISNKGQEANYFFPLYIYPDSSEQTELEIMTNRQPNLNLEIVKNIAEKLNLKFTNEKENTQNTFAPIDIFDYIYAILNSPKYREKYKEFLKIDFPRVPYPINQENFWKLVELGSELRQIHLLESPIVEKFITSYPKSGNNKITHKITKNDWEFYDTEKKLGKIWINDEQYFDKIPLVAWDFFIGGYQPAQKWLKDRFGRDLNFDEILHYQKIIVALNETDRLMKEIDKIMKL